jgi:asparagine synthase (glutamine-hydrolysing)
MCGITGFFSYKNKCNTKKYYDAHIKIAHRGPDDEGFIYKNKDNNIEYLVGDDTIDELKNRNFIYKQESSSMILGHRRLSIIDLTSAGHQPYNFENLSLVYNGEIYNYIELRYELIVLGYEFETNSDTEVFLKAYHCWGAESFNKFNGMWASAIYDKEKDTILLTRDRFGIKPLYYSLINDNLIFGSEIKFVSSFLGKNYINKDLVYSYLRHCNLEHTNETFIKDIYSLDEGSYILYDNKITKNKYYNLSKKNDININNTLNNALKLRMRSDVEVGALLSGGIDSSTLVCKLNNDFEVKKFQTFTADFKEKEFSEKNYVEDTLRQTNFEGHFININSEDIKNNMEEMMYIHETPVRSMSVFLQYKIFEYIKKETNVKVTLSGQGADEIFSGYTNDYYYYLISLLLNKNLIIFVKEFNIIKKKLQISSFNLIKKLMQIYLHDSFSKKDKYGIFIGNIKEFKYTKKYKNYFKDKLYKSLSFSALKEYLRNEDRNSMYFSIESRLPYLDYNLVEEAFSLNNTQYIKNGETKYELKKIANKLIPSSIINRKDKMGFISPQEIWQKKELKDEFDRVFELINKEGLFEFLDNKKIYELYQNYQKGLFNDWALIWRFYCLYYYTKVWNIKELK